MGWNRLLLDHVTNRGVALQPTLVHPGQHQNVTVHIIVDLHKSLVVVETMQPAYILLQCALPGDRHGQKERVETRVVKPFSDVASRRQNHSRFVFRHCRQGCRYFPTLLFSHAALQDEDVLGNTCKLGCEILEMLSPASQKQWA